MTDHPHLSASLLAAAEALIAAVTFDDSGINGRGGNGGLLSRETIRKADALRNALNDIRRVSPEEAASPAARANGGTNEANHAQS